MLPIGVYGVVKGVTLHMAMLLRSGMQIFLMMTPGDYNIQEEPMLNLVLRRRRGQGRARALPWAPGPAVCLRQRER